MYNMYRKCVNVVNNTFAEYPGAVATLEVYDIVGNRISNTIEKTIDIRADGAPAAVEYAVSGTNRLSPRTIGLVKNENNSYEPYRINYFGKITEAYGVTEIWDYDDIQTALTGPPSDVYFIRLELRTADGRLLSLNSYASLCEMMWQEQATPGTGQALTRLLT